jgi:hypothetical protein
VRRTATKKGRWIREQYVESGLFPHLIFEWMTRFGSRNVVRLFSQVNSGSRKAREPR